MTPGRSLPSGVESPGRVAIRAWTYVALWAGVILLASSESFSATQTGRWLSWLAGLAFGGLPSDELDMMHGIVRKTAHFVEYGVLGLLAHRAFSVTWPSSRGALRLAGTVVVALACAALDEGHQSFLALRTGSAWDVLLDLSGASFGMAAHRARLHGGLGFDRATFGFGEGVSS